MRGFYVAAFVLFAAAASSLAFAQTAQDDPVAACRAAHASDSSAHITCLEQAIQTLRGVHEQEIAAVTEAAQQQIASQDRRPAWAIPGFRRREEEALEESVRVRITNVAYTRDGYGRFMTEDGQVWRETVTAPERRRLERGQSYEAVIDRGMFGGFRMNIDGIRWEYKVEPMN